MTKRNLLLASLLLVFGLGVMAPAAMAQGNGTVFNVAPSLYTLRPNSIGDAGGQIYMSYGSGLGTIAGGELFTVTFSRPIVGASGIAAPALEPVTEFCDDTNSAIPGVFCSSLTITASGNVLYLLNGLVPIPGFTSGWVTFWGLRFDTVGMIPGTFITATVGAVLNQNYPISFGAAGVTVSGSVNVGQVATTAAGGTVYATIYEPAEVLACFGTGGADFAITVAEQWSGAWTSLSDETALAPYAPTAGLVVTNGSNIAVTFTGIPQGVTVAPYDIATLAGSATWGPWSPASYTGIKPNDTATFTFTLTSTIRDEIEAVNFWFDVDTNGAIPEPTPPVMSASVTLAPATPTAQPAYPAFTYPNGPLAEEPTYPLGIVEFISCQTNLLFPYVTNYTAGASGGALGNWDTGIVVSNTSSDPYTDTFGGAVPTAGTCVFSVYASTTGSLSPSSDAAPVTTFTTPPVYTGGILPFLLSQTTAKGLPGGYAIAVCNFLNGTGYAEVVDNAGIGSWGVMGSYLAYVIAQPFFDPRWFNSEIGEFAITPWPYYVDFNNAAGGAHKGMRQMVPPTTK